MGLNPPKAGIQKGYLININGKRLTIKGKDYTADQNVGWKIAGYLMMKNLDQKTDLSLVKTAHEILDRLSKRYGEPNPFITEIKPGVTEKFGLRAMYDVHLKGNFRKGNLHADNLYFSMLESGSTVWTIQATSSNNKIVWEEN